MDLKPVFRLLLLSLKSSVALHKCSPKSWQFQFWVCAHLYSYILTFTFIWDKTSLKYYYNLSREPEPVFRSPVVVNILTYYYIRSFRIFLWAAWGSAGSKGDTGLNQASPSCPAKWTGSVLGWADSESYFHQQKHVPLFGKRPRGRHFRNARTTQQHGRHSYRHHKPFCARPLALRRLRRAWWPRSCRVRSMTVSVRASD